jgi:hypothetical protein
MPLPLVFNTTSGFYEEPEPLIDPELADYTSMKMRMVIDSGTTLMYLPNSVADHIASLFSPPATYVEMANIYAVDCDAKVPRLGVIISNRTFWIDKRDLINDWGLLLRMMGSETSLREGGLNVCVVCLYRDRARGKHNTPFKTNWTPLFRNK